MTLTKSETYGIFGTVFIHLLLVLYLTLFGFDKSEPTIEEGLAVNFGNIDEAAGLFEPEGDNTQQPAPAETVPPTSQSEKTLISQDQEPSAPLIDKKKKEADQNQIKEKQFQTEQKRKAESISSQTAKAFGVSSGKGVSQGAALSGNGNQGNPNGDPNASGATGSSYGNFSLTGRSLNGGLPRPSYSIQEDGDVVVRITVNSEGAVTSATISLQGTNTDNSTLRNAALAAAKQAKFNPINGTQNQSGTITYHFRLK